MHIIFFYKHLSDEQKQYPFLHLTIHIFLGMQVLKVRFESFFLKKFFRTRFLKKLPNRRIELMTLALLAPRSNQLS